MRIDLNADVGEGFGAWTLGDDDALLDVVTSANVACGFHAGDPTIMQRVCAAAAARGVAIGAQVGYRDLAGFGRRRMDVAPDDLIADVLYQLGALEAFARIAGTSVRYVKPHGALYNTAADDPVQAGAIASAVARYDSSLPVLGLPGSAVEAAASERGIRFVGEAFADRGYTCEGRLVPRGQPGAVHTDEPAVVAQALALAERGAATMCLHGDTPGAVSLARAVRAALIGRGATIVAFTS